MACGIKLIFEDGMFQPYYCRFLNAWEGLLILTGLYSLLAIKWMFMKVRMTDPKWKEPEEIDWVIGACLMVRREILERVGGLDENFFMYCEDMDWCRRIKQAGWKIYYLPQAQIIHYRSKSYSPHSVKVFLEGYKSWFVYLRKYHPRVLVGLVKTGVIVIETAKVFFQPQKFKRYAEFLKIISDL